MSEGVSGDREETAIAGAVATGGERECLRLNVILLVNALREIKATSVRDFLCMRY
jgi:hypothetical protein